MEELFGISMDDLSVVLLGAVGLFVLTLLVLGWRNRVILRLGLRNIPRRRAQTALIVLGLMLSTLIVAAAFGTGDTMTYSFRRLALDQLGEVDEVISTGGSLSFTNLQFGTGADSAPRSRDTSNYFDTARFEELADEIANRKADGDTVARLVEALTPVVQQNVGPVINRTARQSEPSIAVVGYDPTTADAFDALYALNGKRVTIAELGPDAVYLSEAVADELAAEPGHQMEILGDQGADPMRVMVQEVVKVGGLPGQLIMHLDRAQMLVVRPGKINAILVSNTGDSYDGERYSVAVSGLLQRLLRDSNLEVDRTKQTFLLGADLVGSIFTTIFIGFGSFSIAAALMLIFLIFVMLAAERQREMGMARAVGTRRRHLVQMFVFEGTVYDLVAAAVGAVLGAAVGLATVGVLARSFESLEGIGSFRLQYHLEPRSLIVAYCLGVLLTFLTVAISAWRVSRLNIVSAIRDLPPPPSPDAGIRTLFVEPWQILVDALRQMVRLRLHLVAKRLLWDGPIASLSFFWALIGRGPLTVLFGFLSLVVGLNVKNGFAFNFGVSLILIGIGLVARWVMRVRHVRPERRDRIAFSFAGISLLIYWSLPYDALDLFNLPDFNAGPEMFALSGVMMVAGAVWTIIYNSDLLLGAVTRSLSRFTSLLPVVRTAIAYPLSSKFRTGLTIAMFALVIFMLVFMSVFVHIINQAMAEEEISDLGDYDIEAAASPANPISDLSTAIAASPELNAADFVAIDRQQSRFVFIGGSRSFFIKLAEGVDPEQAARALESAFLDHGLETAVIRGQIRAQQSLMNSIFGLLQAFMGLGLVVGSASIGIISTRAVVERRQQIGVLRAIGYRPWMIQWSFLLEASFVSLLGIMIGIGLGLILAYNFYNSEVASAGPGFALPFAIPWGTLGVVVAIAYAMSMLTTYFPSWQAARVYPAEALRYE
jgi:putative ABC transport system permease protein